MFASCGDFDGNQIKRESQHKEFDVAVYLKRWINLKKVLPRDLTNAKEASAAFDTYGTTNKIKPVMKGMEDMLKLYGLELEGKHHSGIDDVRNLVRCIVKALQSGFRFTQGMVHNR